MGDILAKGTIENEKRKIPLHPNKVESISPQHFPPVDFRLKTHSERFVIRTLILASQKSVYKH